MLELILAAIGADSDAKSKVMQIVIETEAMKQRIMAKSTYLEDSERGILAHISSVLGGLLSVNPEDEAAKKIQACWRGHRYDYRPDISLTHIRSVTCFIGYSFARRYALCCVVLCCVVLCCVVLCCVDLIPLHC